MKSIASCLVLLLFLGCFAASSAGAQENLVVNGGFETPASGTAPSGWEPFWSRDANSGSMVLDTSARHSGAASLRVTHTGARDWSVGQSRRVPVKPGEIYLVSGWVKSEQGEAQIGVVTRDAAGETLDWSYGSVSVGGQHDWCEYRRRFVVPKGCATVQVRLIGNGGARLWLDDASLVRQGSPRRCEPPRPPAPSRCARASSTSGAAWRPAR